MNSNSKNYSSQHQIIMYPYDNLSLDANPIQAPINNLNQINLQQDPSQPTSINPILSGNNPVNLMPSQINPAYQQTNFRESPSNQNEIITKPQYLNQNSPNMIYNQSPMINTNLAYTRPNEYPIPNNIISYNQVINSNNNMIQGKYNQVYPKNINQLNLGNNSSEKEIINKLIKNSLIQNTKNEAMHGHPPIPTKSIIEAMKSICKISYYYDNKPTCGTGFFMKYSASLKLLITNYHVIYPALINNNIQIEIWNNKKMTLNLKGRYIQFLDLPKDITAIEIKTEDEIYNDIQFLSYDLNYYHSGYNIYKDKDIFSIEHPLGQEAAAASGKIINIYNFEFDHDIDTDNGSSGSPIILLNSMMVIGVHKNTDKYKVNGGTFIGEIINEINQNQLKKNQNNINQEGNQTVPKSQNRKNFEENLEIQLKGQKKASLLDFHSLASLPFKNYYPAEFSPKPFHVISGYGYNSYYNNYHESRIKVQYKVLKNFVTNKNEYRAPISYFGIFDGHGGDKCCQFLKENLDGILFNQTMFPNNVIESIKETFKSAESKFKSFAVQNGKLIDKSGSCILIALMVNDIFYVINLGDSRALYSRDGGKEFYQVTRDHKPNDPKEKARIEKAGGKVYYANKTVINGVEVTLKEEQFGPGFKFPYRLSPSGLAVSLIY